MFPDVYMAGFIVGGQYGAGAHRKKGPSPFVFVVFGSLLLSMTDPSRKDIFTPGFFLFSLHSSQESADAITTVIPGGHLRYVDFRGLPGAEWSIVSHMNMQEGDSSFNYRYDDVF